MGWRVEFPRGRRVGRLGKALSVEGTRLEHCDVTGSYGSCRGDYSKIDLGDLYIEYVFQIGGQTILKVNNGGLTMRNRDLTSE